MIRLCQWPDDNLTRDGYDLDKTPGITRKDFCMGLVAILTEGATVGNFIKTNLKDEDWQKWCRIMTIIRALANKLEELGAPEDWIVQNDVMYLSGKMIDPLKRFLGVMRTTMTKNHALNSNEIKMIAGLENLPDQYIFKKIRPRPTVMG